LLGGRCKGTQEEKRGGRRSTAMSHALLYISRFRTVKQKKEGRGREVETIQGCLH
jgi:hypothetical protein